MAPKVWSILYDLEPNHDLFIFLFRNYVLSIKRKTASFTRLSEIGKNKNYLGQRPKGANTYMNEDRKDTTNHALGKSDLCVIQAMIS